MLISQFTFSQKNNIEIDSLSLCNVNFFLVDTIDIKKIPNIKVDSVDLICLRSLLQKLKANTFAFYKPAAISIYGLINNSKDNYLRICRDNIYFSGNKCHYFPKKKEDKKWLCSFFEKYKKELEKR